MIFLGKAHMRNEFEAVGMWESRRDFPHSVIDSVLQRTAFIGTDRGLLRSVLDPMFRSRMRGTWAPRPRRQSQKPPLQKSFAIPALPWPSKPRLRYLPGFAPTTRLNALLKAAPDS
jgi:hypothetical protein